MAAIGRQDLADDPGLAHNRGAWRADELDGVIADWCAQRPGQGIAGAGRGGGAERQIFDIMTSSATSTTRRAVCWRRTGCRRAAPAAGDVPKLADTPGATRWLGPALGLTYRRVLREFSYTVLAIEQLRADGAI
jgi:formyl-CoA transferase